MELERIDSSISEPSSSFSSEAESFQGVLSKRVGAVSQPCVPSVQLLALVEAMLSEGCSPLALLPFRAPSPYNPSRTRAPRLLAPMSPPLFSGTTAETEEVARTLAQEGEESEAGGVW